MSAAAALLETNIPLEMEVLIRQKNKLITELEIARQLDESFRMLEMLKQCNGRLFVARMVLAFKETTETCLAKVYAALKQVVVDFQEVLNLAISLKGSCISIGACSLAQRYTHLRYAAAHQSKQECYQLLDQIRQQYDYIIPKLTCISELEMKIIEIENRGIVMQSFGPIPCFS